MILPSYIFIHLLNFASTRIILGRGATYHSLVHLNGELVPLGEPVVLIFVHWHKVWGCKEVYLDLLVCLVCLLGAASLRVLHLLSNSSGILSFGAIELRRSFNLLFVRSLILGLVMPVVVLLFHLGRLGLLGCSRCCLRDL